MAMTRHQARMSQPARRFWGLHDAKQRAREAVLEREAEHYRTDPNEHVRLYECFQTLVNVMGDRDAAMRAWCK
jgi:hypothetical protein